MFDLIATSNKTWHKAIRLLVTLLIALLLGKLVSLLPVMGNLVLFRSITASNAVWFLAEISALCLFYFFARYAIESIPNKGGALYFLRGIASPLAMLVMVILIQDLIWQLLEPFVRHTGKTLFFGIASLAIIAVSVWLILKAYEHAGHLASGIGELGDVLSRLTQTRKSSCPHCQAEISAKARFCDKCGHKMPEAHYCPECGVMVGNDQNYCRDCGASLHNQGTTETDSES
ncbi:MAG: zinc ribbon domain-containing protein [Gammaproteobacteria bacterium]